MPKVLTVGELKKALENVPDNLRVELVSDSGVDQGEGEIIVEKAYRVKYRPNPNTHIEVDYFAIYANDYDEEDSDDD